MSTYQITIETRADRAKSDLRIIQNNLTQINNISIRTGRTVGRELGRGAKKATSAFRTLLNTINSIVGLLTGLVLARRLTEISDAATTLRNRLKLVTDSLAELNVVQTKVAEIARRSRVGLEATATIYQRTRRATQQLGLSQNDTLQIVENLNKAVIVSGATSREAAQGLVQLSQALAANRLGGDELRSVLEQLPFVAEIIADEFNKNAKLVAQFGTQTAGSLKQVGQQGALTADLVVAAFQNSTGKIEELFGKLAPTIGQGLTAIESSFLQLVSRFQEATGLASVFAAGLLTLADNLELAVRLLAVVSFTIGVTLAQKAIPTAIAAVKSFYVTLGLPGVAIAALGALVAALLVFSDQIIITEKNSTSLFDYLRAILEVTAELFRQLGQAAVEGFKIIVRGLGLVREQSASTAAQAQNDGLRFIDVVNAIARAIDTLAAFIDATVLVIRRTFNNLFENLLGAAKVFANSIASFVNPIAEKLGVAIQLPEFETSAFKDNIADIAKDATTLFKLTSESGGAQRLVDSIVTRAESFATARKALENASVDLDKTGQRTLNNTGKKSEAKKKADRFLDILREIRNEITVLNAPRQDRERVAELLAIQESAGRRLSSTEKKLLVSLLDTRDELQRRVDVLENIQGPQEDFNRLQRTLKTLLAEGVITIRQYSDSIDEAAQSMLNIKTFNSTLRELNQENEKQANLLGLVGAARVAAARAIDAQIAALDTLTQSELEEIEARARGNNLLERTQQIIDDVRGATQTYTDQVEALTQAQETLNLSSEQYARRLQQIQDQASGFSVQNIEDELLRQRQLFNLFGQERERSNTLLDARRASEDTGISIDLESLDRNIRQTQNLKEQQRLLEEIKAPQQAFNQEVAALSGLFNRGLISGQQFTDRYRQSLNDLQGNVTTVATEIGKSFDAAFNRATDSFLNFLQTGSINIRQFASDAIKEVTRVLLKFLALRAAQGIGSAFPGFIGGNSSVISSVVGTLGRAAVAGASGPGGSVAGSLSNVLGTSLAGFANGGEFTVGGQAGRDRNLVQFMATRGEQVSVRTPTQAEQGSGSNGGVTVVNSLDPREVTNQLLSRQGQQVIMNVINNNSSQVRRLLNRS